MGAEWLLTKSLTGEYGDVLASVAAADLPPSAWAGDPEETFEGLGLKVGVNIQVEIWKLFTKKPVDWNDYFRLSVFGKSSPYLKSLNIRIKYNIVLCFL